MNKSFAKGSPKRLAAAKKAAATRKRNAALRGLLPAKSKVRGISVKKLKPKKLVESRFHELHLNTPIRVFISKSLRELYISPDLTAVK